MIVQEAAERLGRHDHQPEPAPSGPEKNPTGGRRPLVLGAILAAAAAAALAAITLRPGRAERQIVVGPEWVTLAEGGSGTLRLGTSGPLRFRSGEFVRLIAPRTAPIRIDMRGRQAAEIRAVSGQATVTIRPD